MEPKETTTTRPRVIVRYLADKGLEQREQYCAAFVEGYGGGDLILDMPMGRHLFSRRDGTWLEGPCTNYVDAKIVDFDKVEASVQAGYGGDVEMHAKNMPMTAVRS